MKHLRSAVIILLLSYLLYGLLDPTAFDITKWDRDTAFNCLHTWLVFLSTYYLYQALLLRSLNNASDSSARFMIRLLTGICLVSLVWIIIADILFYNVYYGILDLAGESTFFEFDLPLAVVVLFIGSLYFYQMYVDSPVEEKKAERPVRVEVHKGRSTLYLDPKEISLIFLKNKVVYIYTTNGARYPTVYTLNELTELLDGKHFFRLNRQSIIGKDNVAEILKGDYQKLIVKPKIPSENDQSFVVSKYTAPAFRKWLTNSVKK